MKWSTAEHWALLLLAIGLCYVAFRRLRGRYRSAMANYQHAAAEAAAYQQAKVRAQSQAIAIGQVTVGASDGLDERRRVASSRDVRGDFLPGVAGRASVGPLIGEDEELDYVGLHVLGVGSDASGRGSDVGRGGLGRGLPVAAELDDPREQHIEGSAR